MSLRALLRDALVGDSALRLLLGAATDAEAEAAVYAGNADSAQERPFVNLKWQETSPGMETVDRRPVVVWVHDRPDDYGVVDAILRRVREILTGDALIGVEAPDSTGGWSVDVQWTGDSPDGFDPDRGTIWRTGTYTVTGSGL